MDLDSNIIDAGDCRAIDLLVDAVALTSIIRYGLTADNENSFNPHDVMNQHSYWRARRAADKIGNSLAGFEYFGGDLELSLSQIYPGIYEKVSRYNANRIIDAGLIVLMGIANSFTQKVSELEDGIYSALAGASGNPSGELMEYAESMYSVSDALVEISEYLSAALHARYQTSTDTLLRLNHTRLDCLPRPDRLDKPKIEAKRTEPSVLN